MSKSALRAGKASLFIKGAWREPTCSSEIEVVDPSTGGAFASVSSASAEDVTAAVSAAVQAFPTWRRISGYDRGQYLRAFARKISDRRPELVELLMRNNGKPSHEADADVGDTIATFTYYSKLAEQLDARQNSPVDLNNKDFRGRTRFEPLGPAGMIVPWNFPLITAAWKIAPALAAGCTVVVKTSQFTPLIELVYGEISQEIELPPGVINIVTGAAEVGAALAADARLRKLSFTGSNSVGARVMESAAARCVPVSLELGGKSPIIVLDDSKLDYAADCIIGGIFYNCGQMCSATSRLLVQRSVADQLLEVLAAKTRAMKIGSPFEQGTLLGPITHELQYGKVKRYLAQAKSDRLRCISGGNADLRENGFFVEPTIFADVPTSHQIWKEEVFGPILAVRTVDSEAEAVTLANDSEFGLAGTVVSGDPERAMHVACQLEAGHIWINTPQILFPETAWGGFKNSGIGRELGPWGLNSYLGVKHITAPNC